MKNDIPVATRYISLTPISCSVIPRGLCRTKLSPSHGFDTHHRTLSWMLCRFLFQADSNSFLPSVTLENGSCEVEVKWPSSDSSIPIINQVSPALLEVFWSQTTRIVDSASEQWMAHQLSEVNANWPSPPGGGALDMQTVLSRGQPKTFGWPSSVNPGHPRLAWPSGTVVSQWPSLGTMFFGRWQDACLSAQHSCCRTGPPASISTEDLFCAFQTDVHNWIRPTTVQCDVGANIFSANDLSTFELAIQCPLALSSGKLGHSVCSGLCLCNYQPRWRADIGLPCISVWLSVPGNADKKLSEETPPLPHPDRKFSTWTMSNLDIVPPPPLTENF